MERKPTEDERSGIDWWNRLDAAGRQYWMKTAGNTGRAADAWQTYKLATSTEEEQGKDIESEQTWIIQRCTQKSTFRPELPGAACWQLEYEDFPTPEGVMTREKVLKVLERVCREHPDDEFRAHNLAQYKRQETQ
jgi:hypothetical protein